MNPFANDMTLFTIATLVEQTGPNGSTRDSFPYYKWAKERKKQHCKSTGKAEGCDIHDMSVPFLPHIQPFLI